MRCSLCSYRSILHGTPQSMLHQNFWFLATSPNFADSLGPSPTGGGGVVYAHPLQRFVPLVMKDRCKAKQRVQRQRQPVTKQHDARPPRLGADQSP